MLATVFKQNWLFKWIIHLTYNWTSILKRIFEFNQVYLVLPYFVIDLFFFMDLPWCWPLFQMINEAILCSKLHWLLNFIQTRNQILNIHMFDQNNIIIFLGLIFLILINNWRKCWSPILVIFLFRFPFSLSATYWWLVHLKNYDAFWSLGLMCFN